MECVELSNDGTLKARLCKVVNGKLKIGNKDVHLQYKHETNGLALYSTKRPNTILKGPIFDFQLPPPLNSYVYPIPLYGILYEAQTMVSFGCVAFKELCDTMHALATKSSHNMAVYDVPLTEEDECLEEVSDEDSVDESETSVVEDSNDEEWDESD